MPAHYVQAAAGSAFTQSPWLSSLLLGGALISLLVTYVVVMVSVLRLPDLAVPSRGWLYLLLGGVCIFGITLLIQPLLFSDDVFTYMFSGRILVIYGANPLNTAPFQFPHDSYLSWVISGRAAANIFGPFWLCICSLLAGVSNNPATSLFLFKSMALIAHIINCVLVWMLLGKLAPTRRLPGTLLYAWSPLSLIELVGSGHSESILLTLLLLATWLYVLSEYAAPRTSDNIQSRAMSSRLLSLLRRRWFLHGSALLVLGLAISTNLIALLIAPLYLWFAVRKEPDIGRALRGFCWRALLVVTPPLLIMLPFWRGADTFFALTSAIDMAHFVHAPVGMLATPLRAIFELVAARGVPTFLAPATAADMAVRASAAFIFVLIYAHLFSKVRHGASQLGGMRNGPYDDRHRAHSDFDALLSSCSIAIFWYLILVSGWFWPWYVLWMLWIVVLRRIDTLTIAILLLSGTALFIYAFVGFSRAPLATYQSAVIFGVPLLYLLIVRSKQSRAERNTNSDVRRG